MNKEELLAQAQGVHMTTSEITKGTGDITGLMVLGLAFMDVVPAMAALFTMVWMFFRMIEVGIRVKRMLFDKDHDRRDGDAK